MSFAQSLIQHSTTILLSRLIKMLSHIVALSPSLLFPLLIFTAPATADYPTTGTTVLIPWAEREDHPGTEFTFDITPHARIQFSRPGWNPGANWSFSVDTGTCGIVAYRDRVDLQPAEQIDPVPSDPSVITNQGQQWLSSSQILYIGYWVQRTVTFMSTSPQIVTRQPVFAITEKFTGCKYWEPSYGNTCPGATQVTDKTTFKGVSNLGIGYGRTYDGQPQGTPDKNPLLNIVSIGGVALNSLTTFHPGWRIDDEGIQVGLTQDIWDTPGRTIYSAALTTPGGIARPSPPESQGRNPQFASDEVKGCVKFPFNTETPPNTCTPVALLLDTGIGWSSIRVYKELAEAVRIDSTGQRPKPEQIIDIQAGDPPIAESIQLYKFTSTGSVPLDCYWTPDYTRIHFDNEHGRRKFVNTGRRAFRVWAFAYDPWNGRVGFQKRPVAETCSTPLLTYSEP